MEKFETAKGEIDAIRVIIERRNRLARRIRYALFALLAVALFARFLGDPSRSLAFSLTSAILACGLGAWLVHQNTITYFANHRMQDIEYHVRNDISQYDGPRFSESLTGEPRSRRKMVFVHETFEPQVWLPVTIAFMCVFIAWMSARNQELSTLPPGVGTASLKTADSALIEKEPLPPVLVSCAAPPLKADCPAVTLPESTPGSPHIDTGTLLGLVAGTALIGALGILGGAALLLFGRGRVAKAMGVVSLLAGAALQFHLIRDVKIEKLFEMGFAPNVEIVVNNKLAPGDFFPRLLGTVKGFASGEEDFDKVSQESVVAAICGQMRPLADSGKGLLVIVGSTDRAHLTGDKRHRFDSNVGLARARGEAVKKYLDEKCKLTERGHAQLRAAIVLVSGPETTPPFAAGISAKNEHGYEPDRKVDVFQLSVGAPESAASDAEARE